jgi:hypothetical protein
MKIEGSVALVTGADRGLGQADARELVSRGARSTRSCIRWRRSCPSTTTASNSWPASTSSWPGW